MVCGRKISGPRVAVGPGRVQRPTVMMGEVVGMAASLCKRQAVLPRDIYRYHLPELKALMKAGVGRRGFTNNQHYNEGATLPEKPVVQ